MNVGKRGFLKMLGMGAMTAPVAAKEIAASSLSLDPLSAWPITGQLLNTDGPEYDSCETKAASPIDEREWLQNRIKRLKDDILEVTNHPEEFTTIGTKSAIRQYNVAALRSVSAPNQLRILANRANADYREEIIRNKLKDILESQNQLSGIVKVAKKLSRLPPATKRSSRVY